MLKQKSIFFIIALLTAVMAYVAILGVNIPIGNSNFVIKGSNQMRFGIDIKGGVDATYEPLNLGRAATTAELDSARTIIETRLDSKNILDRDVSIDKENGRILVRFPWKSDETDFNPQKAIAELGETARLTFRDSAGNILLEGKNVKESKPEYDTEKRTNMVSLVFDSEGSKLFAEATGRLVNQRISIFMDDTPISSPTVNEQINEGRAVITGMANATEAKALSEKINSGALPFSLISRSHNTISPTLGSGALDVMVKAGICAFLLICIFMLLYYRLPGFVACIALLMQVTGQLLALSIPQFTLTLPGIAGVILSIGMGVDANIIIAERIKEELLEGKTLSAAIDSGFKRAFASVFDGNITVMIVALILMWLGSGAMLSFAYSLLTGVILNFIAGVTASRLMIKSLSMNKFLRNPVLYGYGRKI